MIKYNDKQSIRFLTYSQFHGKTDPVGSDFIRVHQLLNHWPEAGLYKYGENPDVLVFTKVFCSQDYQFPRHFEGIKILDICDPMWLEGANVVETAQCMDAITTSTEYLANFMRQFHTNVHFVPDRFDLDLIPPPRKHIGQAKTVVWFGYSHNAELLKPAVGLIEELKLNLLIISNDDPIINRYGIRDKQDYYTYKKYNESTIYQDLQAADFAILPEGYRPVDPFKSNNRTIKANLAGLPVALTPEDVHLYMDGKERQDWLDNNYAKIAIEYDCNKSIEQITDIINEINDKSV